MVKVAEEERKIVSRPGMAKVAAASRRLAAGAFRLAGAAWFLAETLLWLAALAALVSAGIWVAYLAGQQAGWNHPALGWAAQAISQFWKEAWERVGRR